MRLPLPRKLLLLAAGVANAQRFLFIFGDSLSSTGFKILGAHPSASNPLGNPPFPGRTTDNGANWVGVLATSSPDTLAYNFAVVGATVNNNVTYVSKSIPSLADQTTEFLDHLTPPPSYAMWDAANSFACVWLGVNDVDTTYLENQTAVDMLDQTDYFMELQRLYDAGVRRFLLFLVEPIYRDPLWNSPRYVANKPLVETDVNTWNLLLAANVSKFASACAGCTVGIFDPTPVFNNILDNPTAYGAPDASCFNPDGTSCLWWDLQHPGQAIQKAVGQAVYAKLGQMGFYSGANATAAATVTAAGASSTASASAAARTEKAGPGAVALLCAAVAWALT